MLLELNIVTPGPWRKGKKKILQSIFTEFLPLKIVWPVLSVSFLFSCSRFKTQTRRSLWKSTATFPVATL